MNTDATIWPREAESGITSCSSWSENHSRLQESRTRKAVAGIIAIFWGETINNWYLQISGIS